VCPQAAVAFRAPVLIFLVIPPTNVMAPIASPCISVCVYRADAHLCVGCGRNLDEIARWTAMTDAERARVMDELPRRLAALGEPSAAPSLTPGSPP
jgi:predicted Fe-S protein YdhL (DUF1289 family)